MTQIWDLMIDYCAFCFVSAMLGHLHILEDFNSCSIILSSCSLFCLPMFCLFFAGEDGANHLHLYAMKKGDDLRQVQASEDFVNGQHLMHRVQGECYWIIRRFRTIIP